MPVKQRTRRTGKNRTGIIRQVRTSSAIILCRLARRLMHLAGKGGTTLPGRIALLLDKEILSTVSRGMHIVLVTGTNGKTTTCRMLEQALILEGKKCLLNRSGANLLPGITAEFVCNADRTGKPRCDYAVTECDEGALKQITQRLNPEIIVVTNLFRDQLDRYGEVMNTREEILKGIRKAPQSILCLNADCVLSSAMSANLPNPTGYFGIDTPVGDQGERELSDAKYCLFCGTELVYHYHTYAHLGDYECPACGYRRPFPETSLTEITGTGAASSEARMRIRDKNLAVTISLPAVYNLYNALAAACAGVKLGLKTKSITRALETVEAPFGRMEHFTIGGCSIRMILVKNPAGCNQAMEYIAGTGEDYGIVFCLNDRTADGHDISWIWDTDPEQILLDPHKKSVWVSGTRAEDMQLRLKYSGAPEESITLEKDYSRLLDEIVRREKQVFLLPNYTSMLDLRQVLLQKAGGNAFWKG